MHTSPFAQQPPLHSPFASLVLGPRRTSTTGAPIAPIPEDEELVIVQAGPGDAWVRISRNQLLEAAGKPVPPIVECVAKGARDPEQVRAL